LQVIQMLKKKPARRTESAKVYESIIVSSTLQHLSSMTNKQITSQITPCKGSSVPNQNYRNESVPRNSDNNWLSRGTYHTWKRSAIERGEIYMDIWNLI
jgi:hypothetical protein